MAQIQDSILQLVNEALANSAGDFNHIGNYSITGDVNVTGALSVSNFNISDLNVDANTTINIPNLALASTYGAVTHTGSFTFNSGALVNDHLNVNGTLTTNNLAVKNIIATNGSLSFADVALEKTSGTVTHTGDYTISGNAVVGDSFTAKTITAETIHVDNLVTSNGPLNTIGSWIYGTENELNGKGFNWTWGTGQVQLIYRTDGRLWTGASFDVAKGSSYNIDNIPVITAGALGPTITSSNLTKIGTLNNLTVSGDTTLGDFAYFNSTFNRIGLGTEDPVSAINIIENNVSISIGSPSVGLATFGTSSNHDTAIVTDGLPRITVKNNGTINIGDQSSQSAVVNLYGTLNVTSIVTDNRIEKSNSIEFTGAGYGVGLAWNNKQLTLAAGPDRILSSEHIDIGPEKSYYANGQLVLSGTTLGQGVIYSNLVTVGSLESLTVVGDTNLLGKLTANTISFDNGIILKNSSITSAGSSIQIGDVSSMQKPVKVFGPLSININNPDPTLSFSVGGDVNIGDKRFTNSTTAPTTGTYQVGDICWNTAPQSNSYIGWVCVVSGTPGQWFGFGMIASQ
jgi:hypothetical protein